MEDMDLGLLLRSALSIMLMTCTLIMIATNAPMFFDMERQGNKKLWFGPT